MYFGLGLIITAAGAVLRFGVSNTAGDGVNLDTIGLILMAIGIIMAIVGFILFMRGDKSTIVRNNSDGTVDSQTRTNHMHL